MDDVNNHPMLLRHEMNEEGVYSVHVNVKDVLNGETEKERWLNAARIFRETADIIEEKWNMA